ncbi:hypothetical protein L1987_31083 [Smallanthus sonchifolius]|uniref:Uncharacterized protein n=1 Tax=Smallanthus sonchifolius TaxID=185202 RepID=A0ACB9I5W5_9ASTR|nr:hypothetical protein L1987_31083 [Smallanthus sonchifolius]
MGIHIFWSFELLKALHTLSPSSFRLQISCLWIQRFSLSLCPCHSRCLLEAETVSPAPRELQTVWKKHDR